jgi:hypothetical protein
MRHLRDKCDIDDVLIPGQRHAGEADLDDVLPGHLGQPHLIDRIRHPEVQAGQLLARDFAEARDDAKLVGVHTERESKGGAYGRQYDDQDQGDPGEHVRVAGHHLLEFSLLGLHQLLEP